MCRSYLTHNVGLVDQLNSTDSLKLVDSLLVSMRLYNNFGFVTIRTLSSIRRLPVLLQFYKPVHDLSAKLDNAGCPLDQLDNVWLSS